ncbi:transcriptional regulator [Rhizocola hellebori]|uniref:Transcriptional regulator n=2 Tax=Rhizocola hellebori TaxID=1392758 RepID=A0A8J3VGZ0_9ACTN|nr:transcriptional regulator [Rhizocola hellebori]
MVSGESPAVARRRLRLALRKAREARGFTQGQVAEDFDWSLSKVQRIESGDVTVSSTDLKALLAHYDVTDAKRVQQLVEVARASRRKGWWDQPQYREHLTAATLQLLQFETEASAIRVYNPALIPGFLQTTGYAEMILKNWEQLSEADRAVRFEVRMRRRELALTTDSQYYLVLDESVLHREVGGPEVMVEQLWELLRLTGILNFRVRILPFGAGAHLAMLNPFMVLDFGEEENAVLYLEAQMADEMVNSSERIRLYRERFEAFWDVALTEEDTASLIRAKAEKLRSK